ncbi:MAG TPA: hypothetical protein DCL74_02915 [Succinivibrionaceae bacterium]|nr:hypothetical protein [uncultured Lachnoclostridium sp.]HAH70701.1 hypothetical protein [Succinivibrionaceae bacterium]
MQNSLAIKSFLDFVAHSEVEATQAKELLEECDKQTQDILHYLEFSDSPYLERKKITDLIPDIRRARRKAKDTNAIVAPLIKWIRSNKKAISELQQVLGSVRKEEQYQINRAYHYRTDIIEKTLKEGIADDNE